MENAAEFRDKVARGQPCLGTCVSFADPTVSELLSQAGMDFLWIDMEHNPLTLAQAQQHIMATRASRTAALVRVGRCDEALIKPLLDNGADGIIVPMVSTPEQARELVSLCRYPPLGKRGFGPRRASRYGRIQGPAFCKQADEAVITIAQIELMAAVKNLEAILQTPGLDSIVIGPCDLAGSMGYPGECSHPEVLRTVGEIIQKARAAGIMVGLGTGQDPVAARGWLAQGIQWIALGSDWGLLSEAADRMVGQLSAPSPAPALDRDAAIRGTEGT